MKTKTVVLVTFFTFASFQSNAQHQKAQTVKSVLASYLNAGDVNNIKLLKPHLHKDFRVALFDKKKDAISILDRETYSSFIKSKKFGGYKRNIAYEDIQFIGDHMASVRATLTSPGKPTLKNFYSLVNTKGKWSVLQDYVVLTK